VANRKACRTWPTACIGGTHDLGPRLKRQVPRRYQHDDADRLDGTHQVCGLWRHPLKGPIPDRLIYLHHMQAARQKLQEGQFMSSRTVTLSVDVDVDIELEHFSTADLICELEKRQHGKGEPVKVASTPPLNTEQAHPLHEIYYAFKFGLSDRATDLARAYVCDELGVVL
jgi:hypothetical protein